MNKRAKITHRQRGNRLARAIADEWDAHVNTGGRRTLASVIKNAPCHRFATWLSLAFFAALLLLAGLLPQTASAQSLEMQIIAGSCASNGSGGYICQPGNFPTQTNVAPATTAQLYYPSSVGAGSDGSIYIADSLNSEIRQIDPSGNIHEYAVLPVGDTTNAVVVDGLGNVYYGDKLGCVFKNATGAQTCSQTSAPITAFAVDNNNNFYSLVNGYSGFWTLTEKDSNGNPVASLSAPPALLVGLPVYGLAVDSSGNAYTIASGRIAQINLAAGTATYVTQPGQIPGLAGEGANGALARDAQGDFYFIAYEGAMLEEFNPATGAITPLAGTGTDGFNNPTSNPNLDAPMPATQTEINQAGGISIGPDGSLYIADTANNLVRKVPNAVSNDCQECGPTSLPITDAIPTNNFTQSWALNPATHELYVVYPYTSNSSLPANVVTVFGTANDAVLANIPVGNNPGPIAIDTTNDLIYVGNTNDNTVSVINGATNQVNATVAVSGSPIAIAADSALNKAYVTLANGTNGAGVSVIAGPSGGNPATHLDDIAVDNPSAVVVDTNPARNGVYVRSYTTAGTEVTYALVIVNPNTDAVTATLPISSASLTGYIAYIAPDSMAIDESTGNVVIGDTFDSSVYIYNFSDQNLSYAYSPQFTAAHVAVDSVNQIYYFSDGYGDTAYLDEKALQNNSITQLPGYPYFSNSCSSTGSALGVDATTDQAYITTCDAVNGAVLHLFDGATHQLISSLSLGTRPASGGGSFAIIVDSSNLNPTKHTAYVENSLSDQIDVVNGPQPPQRPAITLQLGSVSGQSNYNPFQDVGVGQTATWEVGIQNTGNAPLTMLTPLVQDSQDPGSLQINNSCASALPLAPGGTCAVYLSFTPSQVENFSGAVLFLDDAPNTPQPLAISGAGVPATGQLTIAPNSLPLGVVGQLYNQALFTSGLTGSAVYSISSGSLPPGLTFGSTGLITGTPTTAGTWTFTITVSDTGSGKTGSQFYSLTITSTAAGQTTASLSGLNSSGDLSFGNIEVFELSATKQVTVENSGSANLQIPAAGVTLTGPNAVNFSESDNCGGQTLQPFQSCTINVAFLPTIAPTANEVGEIVIGGNAALAPIILTGTSSPALGAPSPLPVAVSVDNSNPPILSSSTNVSFYSTGTGIGGLSAGGKFVAFSTGATNLPGPQVASPYSISNQAYLRTTCVGTNSGCEESTQYISYGPTIGPGANGGLPCNAAGGSVGSTATGIDSTGQFVLFESDICGFTGSSYANAHQIYLRNMQSGTTSLLSVDSTGQPFNAGASNSSMSSDARFFAFETTSSQVVGGFANPNGNNEVYWLDTCVSGGAPVTGCTPQTVLISKDNPNDGTKDASQDPAISATGRYVAYDSYATMIQSTPSNNSTTGIAQVYLYDTCAGAPQGQNCTPQTKLISVDANGNAVGGTNPSVSSDGRFVAFVSGAATLVSATNPPAGGIFSQAFLTDTCLSNGTPVAGCTAQTYLVSGAAGQPGNNQSYLPFISADGVLVTFTTYSSNLVASNNSGQAAAVYEYTNCLASNAPSNCTQGLQLISVDSNGNLLQNITTNSPAPVDSTDGYFGFEVSSYSSGYGSAPWVYLGATTLSPASGSATYANYTGSPALIQYNNVATVSLSANVNSTAAQQVFLTNTGGGTLAVSSITAQAGNDWTITNIVCNSVTDFPFSTAVNLGPGQSCTVSLQFAPTTDQFMLNGVLNILDNAAGSNAQAETGGQSILLQGNSTTPYASFSPASLNFGSVNEGTPVTQTETLTNTGNGPLTIQDIYFNLLGGNDPGYSYTALCNQVAAQFPVTLNNGQNCVVTVQFDPFAAGNLPYDLFFADNAGTGESNLSSASNGSLETQDLPISGIGVSTSPIGVAAPVANFSVGSTLGFNSQSQSQQTVAISNIGEAPASLSLASIAISPAGAPFTLSSLNCFNGATSTGAVSATLPSSGYCTVTVTYTGSSPTTDTGTLVFTDNAALSNLSSAASGSNYTQSISLTGSGSSTAQPGPPSATVNVPSSGPDNEQITVTDQPFVWATTIISDPDAVIDFSAGPTIGFNTQSGTQTLIVSNIGEATLNIASPALAGSGAAQYTISLLACSTPPGASSISLPSGGACTFSITYTASANPAADNATIAFTDNAALSNLASTASGANYSQVITLTGSGATSTAPPPPSTTIPVTDNEAITVTDTVTVTAAAPLVKIGAPVTNPYTITAGSAYSVVVTLINGGNVPIDTLTLTKATLGSLGALTFPAGTTLSNVAPGASVTLTATFSSSAGAAGKGVPLSFTGTYAAGSLSGNWSVSFRSVTLP